MPNILMMIYVGVDVLFAACGGLLMGFCLMAEQTLRANPSAGNVGPNVLLRQCPLTGREHHLFVECAMSSCWISRLVELTSRTFEENMEC